MLLKRTVEYIMAFRPEHDYVIFHKPYGVLSQFTSEGDHRTLSEFGLPEGIYAAGRLDKDSEGLLLLTNDGVFINKFLSNHPRTYWAQVEGSITDQAIKQLRDGVKLKDGKTAPAVVSILEVVKVPDRVPPIRERKSIPTSWIQLKIFEGKNRQVRRMTAHVGFPTLRLIRVGMGKLFYPKLHLDLPAGNWVKVKKKDIT